MTTAELGCRPVAPLLGLCLLFGSCALPSPERSSSAASPLLGTWELVAAHQVRPNGETEPLAFIDGSAGASGVGIYGLDGWMSAQIMGGGSRPAKPQLAGRFSYTPEEAALVLGSYYAYSGPYEVDAAAGVVRHFVRFSLHPIEIGRTYERRYRLDGETLTLETSPITVDGETRFNRLIWRRAQPR